MFEPRKCRVKSPVKEKIGEIFDDYVQKEKFLGTLKLANKPAKKAISAEISARVNIYLPINLVIFA